VRSRASVALLSGVLLLLVAAPAALAAITVTRAELSGGQLRVEGTGATPNATITIDGTPMGTAASDGRFRIERSGFSSPTCRIVVSDGTTSTQATLSGCTPASQPPPPPAATGTTASFRGLGHLPGWIASQAVGVSGDGSTVVGYSNEASGASRAFRWTAAGGLQELGTFGEAQAASFDGSTIVGQAWDVSTGLGAFRWRAATGLERLPLYDGSDVSADGSVIVSLGLRWTEAGGSQPLGDFGGGYTAALGVSPDGGVVVGYSENAAREARAFRWTAATGLRDLGTNGGTDALASDTSLNGSVVVGQSRNKDFFWQAFRWTAAGGIQNLRTLGGPMSAAYSVSDDGSVIVGKSLINSSSGSERAFRWTTRRGIQDLQRELLDAGVSAASGWILTSASAVSADGTVIVGTGLNPSRQWEAFRATLPLPG
jgi:probable HAF family extracellular repeat protein